MKHTFLLMTVLMLARHLPAQEPNEVQMVFENKKPPVEKGPEPVLFLERVRDQKYLPYIIFNDRYTLDLYMFDEHLKSVDFENNPEVEYYCPKAMFESLGLKGYLTPMLRTPDIFFCPKLKQTCCVGSDFEDLDQIWRARYKNSVQYHQAYLKYYTITVLEQHEAIEAVAKLVLRDAKSETCRSIATNILNTTVNASVIKKSKELLEKFLKFDLQLKRGFLCLLCDYENAKDLDFSSKLLDFNHDICEEMVEHTFDFHYHFNNFVYKYMNSANFLAYCYNEMDIDQSGKIKKDEDIAYIEVDNNQNNEVCARAREGGYNIFVNCLNFCNRYDLWYTKRPLYRDIELMGKIFDNIRTKILQKVLTYVVEAPQETPKQVVLTSKYDKFDIFNKWEFVFSDTSGVRFDHFVDMAFEDL